VTTGALFARAGQRVLVLERNQAFGGAAMICHRGAIIIQASLHETTDPRATLDPEGEIFQALDLHHDIEFVPVGTFKRYAAPSQARHLLFPTVSTPIHTGLPQINERARIVWLAVQKTRGCDFDCHPTLMPRNGSDRWSASSAKPIIRPEQIIASSVERA
jgi:hypothetical protein